MKARPWRSWECSIVSCEADQLSNIHRLLTLKTRSYRMPVVQGLFQWLQPLLHRLMFLSICPVHKEKPPKGDSLLLSLSLPAAPSSLIASIIIVVAVVIVAAAAAAATVFYCYCYACSCSSCCCPLPRFCFADQSYLSFCFPCETPCIGCAW